MLNREGQQKPFLKSKSEEKNLERALFLIGSLTSIYFLFQLLSPSRAGRKNLSIIRWTEVFVVI
jgi:hypothetical protein